MDATSLFLLTFAGCLLILLWMAATCYSKDTPVFFTISEVNPKLSDLVSPTIASTLLTELNQATRGLSWQKWAETELYPLGPDGLPTWDIIPIFAFGHWIPATSTYFPNLRKILSGITGIKTVLFSRMKGYTSLEPHQGWAVLANRVIRCHLGLVVPGKAFISVDGQRQYHQTGKLILFDDSHRHYAANLSPDPRIVLLVDVERPSHLPRGISKVKTSERLLQIVQDYLPGVTLDI